jgi:hypothetical protein
MELDQLIALGVNAFQWFREQPLVLQLILGIGLASVGYFLAVVLRVLVAALIITFRGL